MNVELIVAAVKVGFWVTAALCVVALFAWPMPSDKATAGPAPRVSGYPVRGVARPVDAETAPIAVGYHPVLSARPRSHWRAVR